MTWRFAAGRLEPGRKLDRRCQPPMAPTTSSGSRSAQKRRRRSSPSDASGRIHTSSCQLCVKRRRTRWSAVTVGAAADRARGRRAALKSTRALAVGARGVEVDEPDRLLRRAAVRARRCPSPRRRRRRRAARGRPRAIAAAASADTAPCASSTSAGHAELALASPRPRTRRRRRGRRRSSPGTSRQPRRDEPAGARLGGRERQPARAAEREHELLDRPLVAREQVPLERLERAPPRARPRAASAPGSTTRSTWISKSRAQIVASTPSPSPPASRERPRDRRLARAEEAEHAPCRAASRARAAARHGLRLERARPEPLQLARRPGQHDDDATPSCSRTSPGAVPARPSDDRALGDRRLLADAGLEVRVRPPQPLARTRARCRRSRASQLLVEDERAARSRARPARPCGRRGSARGRRR